MDILGRAGKRAGCVSQAEGRGFEPRFPLQVFVTPSVTCTGGVVVGEAALIGRSRIEPFRAGFRRAEVREGQVLLIYG